MPLTCAACVNSHQRKNYCTEPRRYRKHLTKLICGELGETTGQKQAPTRLSYFEEIDNTFDALFIGRGDSVNVGQCTLLYDDSRCKCLGRNKQNHHKTKKNRCKCRCRY